MRKEKVTVHYDFYVIGGRNGSTANSLASEAVKRARAFFDSDIDFDVELTVDASSTQYTCAARATGVIE